MSIFTKHTAQTAPQGAAEVLDSIKQRYGFVPNLAAYVAESPNTLTAILKLSEAFDQASLTPQEQQVVLLTISSINNCSYCKTVHTALGKKSGLDDKTIHAIVAMDQLPEQRLNALRDFTRLLVEEKGRLSQSNIKNFLTAGFSKAQVFEVIMGVALKTMTNYSNHLAEAEPNVEFVAMAQTAEVA